MTYDHLVEKMLKEQDKFILAIDAMKQQGKLPEELAKATEGIQTWAQASQEKLGSAEVSAKAPDINDVAAFDNALYVYAGMFSHHEQSSIAQWREYAHELINMIRGSHIKAA